MITLRTVKALAPGSIVWDTGTGSVTGFGARRQKGEAVMYVLKYRAAGRQRWATIGRHGSPWTPESARDEAKRLLGEVVRGSDPAAVRDQAKRAPTVEALAQRFLAEHAEAKRKGSTAAEYRRLIEGSILPAFGSRRIADVSRADVSCWHSERSATPVEANRALACLSTLMNFAERIGERPDGSNPCRHVERFREQRRERFLSADEMARLGQALAGAEARSPSAVAAIRLLVFTGARLGEILGLRWSEVRADRGEARLPDSKTGAKTLHLPAPALSVLAGLPRVEGNPFVITGTQGPLSLTGIEKPWRAIRATAGLPDVRLHDLRHSFASVAASSGLGLPIIGKMLGHTQQATTQRYAHLARGPVMQAAETVAAQIEAQMSGRGAEVVPLRA